MGAGGQKRVLADRSRCWQPEAGAGGRNQKMRVESEDASRGAFDLETFARQFACAGDSLFL